MNQRNSRLLPGCFCLLLAACGSAPEKISLRHEAAIRLNARAEAAFRQQDYAQALDDYAQALRIDQSIENAAGIAISRYNLARVLRETARTDQAHLQLDALFAQPALPYPAATLAAAAALQGLLYLESNELSRASLWLDKGAAHCRNTCPVAGSLLLLRAQLALRNDRLDEAGKLADDAIAALSPGAQPMELANALRLSGDIGLAKRDTAKAIASFEQALAIDQKLGLPARIRLDLLRLGNAHARTGAVNNAQDFYLRALTVSEAMGNAKEADEVRAFLKNPGDTPGAKTPARQ
ncbi:MAG TPA: tetratricopeptide repeat protein [Gallionella sp.]|nr:tetratricopeptide repeat protein [Gallionella sp.]